MQDTLTYLSDYTGTNPIYQAEAEAVQPTFVFVVISVSAANPAEFNITAHGLNTDNVVTIAGATGQWAALNGTWNITQVDANNFTVPVNTTGFTGSFNGVISTTAPRTSAQCWKIIKNYFDGSNNLLRTANAAGGAHSQIYDNRASLGYN